MSKNIETMHFVSPSQKYIYLVIIGKHCPDEKTFFRIFPNSTRITEKQFDKLYNDGNGSEIISVADAEVIDEMFPNRKNDEAVKRLN